MRKLRGESNAVIDHRTIRSVRWQPRREPAASGVIRVSGPSAFAVVDAAANVRQASCASFARPHPAPKPQSSKHDGGM